MSSLVKGDDHTKGAMDAPVTLVEYGDYECPYTGRAYPIVKEIQKRLRDRLLFVFRNFPLTQIHPHAQHAAESAEAAAVQGKFWEMHDYLFEHQQALDDDHLARYASKLALDVNRFNRDMSKHTYAARIRQDLLSGEQSGVEGTPTFFINGVRYDESWDLETLLRAIKNTM